MKKGFTLVELMVVIAVMAILATMALFGLNVAQKGARDTQRVQIMSALRASLEKYNGDHNQYPAGGFTAMMSSLAIANPVDPGNGSGPVTYDSGGAAAGWIPVAGVTYAYTTDAGQYTLTVNKEGGSVSNFSNPQ